MNPGQENYLAMCLVGGLFNLTIVLLVIAAITSHSNKKLKRSYKHQVQKKATVSASKPSYGRITKKSTTASNSKTSKPQTFEPVQPAAKCEVAPKSDIKVSLSDNAPLNNDVVPLNDDVVVPLNDDVVPLNDDVVPLNDDIVPLNDDIPSEKPISFNGAAISALNNDDGIPIYLCSNNWGRVGCFFEQSEAIFYQKAQQWAMANKCVIFAKVRIADIMYIPIDIRYNNSYTVFRALSQKHFDFVLARPKYMSGGEINMVPKLVVEIDGLSHNTDTRRERDELIDTRISKYNSKKQTFCKITLIHLEMQTLSNPNSLWRVKKCIQHGNVPPNDLWNSIGEILSQFIN